MKDLGVKRNKKEVLEKVEVEEFEEKKAETETDE